MFSVYRKIDRRKNCVDHSESDQELIDNTVSSHALDCSSSGSVIVAAELTSIPKFRSSECLPHLWLGDSIALRGRKRKQAALWQKDQTTLTGASSCMGVPTQTCCTFHIKVSVQHFLQQLLKVCRCAGHDRSADESFLRTERVASAADKRRKRGGNVPTPNCATFFPRDKM